MENFTYLINEVFLLILIFQFIIGTVLGSFISLVRIRNFRHESIVFPPSHCDFCNHKLQPWELIPVVSFICLRGRCSNCRRRIDRLAFVSEIISGVILISNPVSPSGILETIFELNLLFSAQCDLKRYQIPTWSLVSLSAIGLSITFVNQTDSPEKIIITLVAYLITSGFNHHFRFFGNGDVDLIFIFFLRVPFITVLLIIISASLMAIIKYVIHHRRRLIPFVPYLSTAYFIVFHLWIKK